MKILVTGGAGYIGSHAIRLFRQRGYDVVVYDNLSTGFRKLAEGFPLIVGGIGDAARIHHALNGCEAVIHFAAHAYVGESVSDPQKYFRNNVVDALVLLDAALDAGVKYFVFSSSCTVYGAPATLPVCESEPAAPLNPYGYTKITFERALQSYAAYGLRSVSLRYFNAAGADESGEIGEMHDPETHLIPLAIAAAERTGPPLRVFGTNFDTRDGTCIRDYIHVNDLADAHEKALEYLVRGGDTVAVNLGTGRGYSVSEVIRAVEQETGRDVPSIASARRPGDAPAVVADATLARELLGWVPRRDIGDMVRTAVAWHRRGRSATAT